MTYNGFQGWQSQPLQQQMQQMPAEETEAAGTETESETSQGSTFEYSDFASQILKEAPDEHKSILEPYLTKWDAGTTRRFQDLHNQYKPFADLGWDEETTSQMAEVYRVLNEEPERMYEALKAEFEQNVEEAQNVASEVSESGQAIQGLPPEIMQQLEQQQTILEALAQLVIQDRTEKTTAVEDSEYDKYIELLRKELGDFNDDYVHTMISNGMDGEAAVKQWQSMIQEQINKAASSTDGLPPAQLSSAGGGAVAQQEPQKLGSIPDKDIRSLIANVMTQANQAGQ